MLRTNHSQGESPATVIRREGDVTGPIRTNSNQVEVSKTSKTNKVEIRPIIVEGKALKQITWGLQPISQ